MYLLRDRNRCICLILLVAVFVGESVFAQQGIPVYLESIDAAEDTPALTELARTVEETLRLSVLILDELTPVGPSDLNVATSAGPTDRAGIKPVIISGGVATDDEGGFRLSMTAVDSADNTEIVRLNEFAGGIFDTFTAVDRITEGLLSALSGREIRFGSVSLSLYGYPAGGEVRLDGNLIVTLEETVTGPISETVTMERLPAGEHTLEIRQERGASPFQEQQAVTVRAGETTRLQVAVPQLTADERSTLLMDRYKAIVSSVIDSASLDRNMPTLAAGQRKFVNEIPDQTVADELSGWLSSVREHQVAWQRSRERVVPRFVPTVDGDPREWATIVPVGLLPVRPVESPEGEGNEIRSLRLAATEDSLYFLFSINGPPNRRFSYRLYFSMAEKEHPILMVRITPGRDYNEAEYRDFRTSDYASVSGARITYRTSGNFIEGSVRFPTGHIEHIVGLDHAKVKHDGLDREVDNQYRGDTLMFPGSTPPLREGRTTSGTINTTQLDMEAVFGLAN